MQLGYVLMAAHGHTYIEYQSPQIEPSKRNQNGTTCGKAYNPTVADACKNVVWNPDKPVYCDATDITGARFEGLCGEDGARFLVSLTCSTPLPKRLLLEDLFVLGCHRGLQQNEKGFPDHVLHQLLQQIRQVRLQWLLRWLKLHVVHSMYNPLAVVAYAKGAAAYLAVLSELWMLGQANGIDVETSRFVTRAAKWLQVCATTVAHTKF